MWVFMLEPTVATMLHTKHRRREEYE
jgi:hypothetical protein